MNIQVRGGIKAEIESELPNNIAEIGIDVFAHNDDDEDDPFKNSDSDDNEDDPFNCSENDEEIVHKKKHDLHKNVKISQRAGSLSQLNIVADKDNDTKEPKTKINLQSKEVLLLNYRENDNSANKSRKETTTKRNKNIVENIDWSRPYQTFEGTSVEDDMRKVIVTRVPFSYVAPSEYTIEAIDRVRCNHCQLVLGCKAAVKSHITLQHRDVTNMYHCPYCPYKQKFEGTLKRHIIYRHKSDNELAWFRCADCDFKAKCKSKLRSHILTHMDPNRIMDRMKKCDQCPKMFKIAYSLARHIKYVHEKHKIQKLKCTECDYECLTPGQLKDHKKLWHSNIETLEILKCPNCPYETKVKSRLYLHVRRTHEEKIQCDKCAYTTDRKDKMRFHLITHKKVIDEADMKYRCDKCPYKTYRLHSLTVHKLNHLKPEEIQYFYCYHCQFKSKRKDNLKTHVLRHSEQNEVHFQCFNCDFTAKTKYMLSRHIDKHSKEGENQQSKSVVSKKKPTKRKNPKTKVASPAKQLKGKKKSENDVAPSIDVPLDEEKVFKDENYI